MEMKVKALLPYMGGKRSMAPLVVSQLGKHTQYFEPFCGSAAVLFAKKPSQKETICDLHGDVINLALVVAEEHWAVQLYQRLARTLFAEWMLVKAEDMLLLLPDAKELIERDNLSAQNLDRAYWYFLSSWMARNGTAGTERQDYQIAVRWTAGGGSPTVRWRNAVSSIPAWHLRLQNVVILHRNAFRVLDKFEDTSKTVIYIDPPYPAETRSAGATKNGRGGRYLHEFDHGPDHEFRHSPMFPELCDACRKKKADHIGDHDKLALILRGYQQARIVVSSYDCERIRQLYEGWTFIECYRQKQLHNQGGRGARPKDAPEVLIVNGDAFPLPVVERK